MKISIISAIFLSVSIVSAGSLDEAYNTGKETVSTVKSYWKKATEYYDKYFNKLDDLTGGIVSKCYNVPQSTDLNVCEYIPDIDDVGLNVCKYLPGATGNDTRSLKLRALKRNLCIGDSVDDSIRRAGREFEIFQQDGFGGGNYSGKNKNKVLDKKTAYGNLGQEVATENTLANTAFMSNNQAVLNEMMTLYRLKETKASSFSEVTTSDLVNSLPSSMEDYDKAVDTKKELINLNSENVTPTAISNYLENSLKGLSGAVAVSKASDYLVKQQKTIDIQLDNQIGETINLKRKADDMVNPTQEMVKLLRPDLQATKAAQIKDQIRREAKIRADLSQEAQKQKNIMELITKKALIMNEKFDREQARAMIDSILQ